MEVIVECPNCGYVLERVPKDNFNEKGKNCPSCHLYVKYSVRNGRPITKIRR